jgi:hypothetical protein
MIDKRRWPKQTEADSYKPEASGPLLYNSAFASLKNPNQLLPLSFLDMMPLIPHIINYTGKCNTDDIVIQSVIFVK